MGFRRKEKHRQGVRGVEQCFGFGQLHDSLEIGHHGRPRRILNKQKEYDRMSWGEEVCDPFLTNIMEPIKNKETIHVLSIS
jgi:hypothetical protein